MTDYEPSARAPWQTSKSLDIDFLAQLANRQPQFFKLLQGTPSAWSRPIQGLAQVVSWANPAAPWPSTPPSHTTTAAASPSTAAPSHQLSNPQGPVPRATLLPPPQHGEHSEHDSSGQGSDGEATSSRPTPEYGADGLPTCPSRTQDLVLGPCDPQGCMDGSGSGDGVACRPPLVAPRSLRLHIEAPRSRVQQQQHVRRRAAVEAAVPVFSQEYDTIYHLRQPMNLWQAHAMATLARKPCLHRTGPFADPKAAPPTAESQQDVQQEQDDKEQHIKPTPHQVLQQCAEMLQRMRSDLNLSTGPPIENGEPVLDSTQEQLQEQVLQQDDQPTVSTPIDLQHKLGHDRGSGQSSPVPRPGRRVSKAGGDALDGPSGRSTLSRSTTPVPAEAFRVSMAGSGPGTDLGSMVVDVNDLLAVVQLDGVAARLGVSASQGGSASGSAAAAAMAARGSRVTGGRLASLLTAAQRGTTVSGLGLSMPSIPIEGRERDRTASSGGMGLGTVGLAGSPLSSPRGAGPAGDGIVDWSGDKSSRLGKPRTNTQDGVAEDVQSTWVSCVGQTGASGATEDVTADTVPRSPQPRTAPVAQDLVASRTASWLAQATQLSEWSDPDSDPDRTGSPAPASCEWDPVRGLPDGVAAGTAAAAAAVLRACIRPGKGPSMMLQQTQELQAAPALVAGLKRVSSEQRARMRQAAAASMAAAAAAAASAAAEVLQRTAQTPEVYGGQRPSMLFRSSTLDIPCHRPATVQVPELFDHALLRRLPLTPPAQGSMPWEPFAAHRNVWSTASPSSASIPGPTHASEESLVTASVAMWRPLVRPGETPAATNLWRPITRSSAPRFTSSCIRTSVATPSGPSSATPVGGGTGPLTSEAWPSFKRTSATSGAQAGNVLGGMGHQAGVSWAGGRGHDPHWSSATDVERHSAGTSKYMSPATPAAPSSFSTLTRNTVSMQARVN